jgi:ankyrin repeat protein
MPLSDLPREIVLDIADQLDDADLDALARTNSQIYQFLNKYLYRRDVTRRWSSRSLTWAWQIAPGADTVVATSTVQRAVDAGGHLDPIPDNFHYALQNSAERGHVNLVAALLKLDGINPNYCRGGSALALAALLGHSDVVDLLLAVSNIDPNVKDETDATPLLCACRGGDTSVVRQILVRDDIDLNTIGYYGLMTPLLFAMEDGNMEVINLLLSKDGIDINLRPKFNIGPFMMAIRWRLMEVVESLFARHELDLNVVDDRGDHLLLYSMGLGLDKVKLILDRTNVDPNFVGVHGLTALMMACSVDKEDLDLIEFLLDQGIDVNRQDHDGMTPFCHAVHNGRSKVVKFLLDRDDMDPNLPDARGHTPLFYVVRGNLSAVADMILWKKGIDIHASGGNLSVTDLLLRKKGIDINARNNHGSTALAYACTIYPNDDVGVDFVRILLSHRDIDPNIVDNNGFSALSKVIELGRTQGKNKYRQEIESLLRAAGAR